MPDHSDNPSRKIPATALPRSDADRLAWLRLARSRRVGPVTFIRLIREHGSANAALDALPEVARAAGAKDYAAFSQADADKELAAGQAMGAQLLCLGEDGYPAQLALIGDPPPVLWALGDAALPDRPTVALVGARNASSLGLRMARKLAAELAEAGYVVASGLARGIDAAAHTAALEGGTIAVQAGGIDQIYPQENASLAAEIADKGLRLAEMTPGLAPQARHFPRRNRIISGLSEAVVVIEGAARSGSLITARDALDQGREVMAVPGHPMDARAAGCNMLIRDGATLVRGAKDVIAALERPTHADLPVDAIDAHQMPETQVDTTDLLDLLGPTPVAEDQLIRELSLPPPVVMEALLELDLTGQIERHPGGLVSRVTA